MTAPKDIAAAQERAATAVAALSGDLIRLSREIHAHPQLAFEEHHAYSLLVPFAREQGFVVQERAYGMDTCFRAEWGRGPVTVAICAEYDALPEIGHACGHNLIAACGVGAAVAAARALDPDQVRIVLLGTPAEEGGGGKILMIERGCFDDIDVAMMAHPSPVDFVYGLVQGGARVKVDYYGKAAHQAAMPERGVNALDAMVMAYNAVSQLRQHIRRDARLACIITHGGDAVNVVPEHAAGVFSARAGTVAYLEELKRRMTACIEAGARATGCRVEMQWIEREYAPFRHNHAMAEVYMRHGRAVGKHYLDLSTVAVGGTDMGNVSQVVPAIHPEFAIGAGMAAQTHTREFTEAAATDIAQEAMVDTTRLLAMTAVELALDPGLLADAKREFAESARRA